MRIYSATDVGQKRKMNQDYVFASEGPVGNLPNLFTVADGMGGHNAGDYASSHAVRILVDEIREDADYNPVKVIRHAIEAANTEIRNRAQEDENLRFQDLHGNKTVQLMVHSLIDICHSASSDFSYDLIALGYDHSRLQHASTSFVNGRDQRSGSTESSG